MWTFVKKNLWMWKPIRSANLYMCAFVFAISIADARFKFPLEIILLLCGLIAIIAQAAAGGAMNDFKEDSHQFLQYLPVRWSHVWISNWLEGLLGSLLLVPLLFWHRILTWAAPSATDLASQLSLPYAGSLLASSRWKLPLVLICLMYFSFNQGLLGRSLCKSNKASIVLMLWGQIIFLTGAAIVLVVAMVLPGPLDLCPLLLIQGTIFAACSYAMLVCAPQYWSALRRFLFVGLPGILVSSVLFFVSLAIECQHWQQLDWSEPSLVVHSTVIAGDHPKLLIDVISERSMKHQFLCDPDTGTCRPFGRNLSLISLADSRYNSDAAVFETFRLPDAWWPFPAPVVGLDLTSGALKTLLPDSLIVDRSGARFKIIAVSSLPGGKFLLTCDNQRAGAGTALRVLETDGHLEVPIQGLKDAWATPWISAAGLVLATTYSAESWSGQGRRYVLYNSVSTKQVSFETPGWPICFSSDFLKCVCLQEVPSGLEKTGPSGPLLDRQLVLFDVVTGSQKIVLPPGVLQSVMANSSRSMPSVKVQSALQASDLFDATGFMFDNPLSQAVVLLTRYDGNFERHSLLHLDLATGDRRTLVEESEMAASSIFQRDFSLGLCGFTPDGLTCYYREGATLTKVGIAIEARPRCIKINLPSEHSSVTFSPAGTSLLSRRYDEPMPGRGANQTFWLATDHPETRIELPPANGYEFLDEHRLISSTTTELMLTDLTGRKLKSLLPHDAHSVDHEACCLTVCGTNPLP